MVSHPQYNLALRLAGVVFRLLLATAPAAIAVLLVLSTLIPHLRTELWMAHVLRWSLGSSAVGLLCLLVGSIWDAI